MNADKAFNGVCSVASMTISRLEMKMGMVGKNSKDIDSIHEITDTVEDCETFFNTVELNNVSFMGIGCFAETAKDWVRKYQ